MRDIDLYEKLKLMLGPDFQFDDLDKKISVVIKENIDEFEKKVRAILGSEYDVDAEGGGKWRISPRWIRTDGKTIGIDKYGQLEVIGTAETEELEVLREEVSVLRQSLAEKDRDLYRTRRTLMNFMKEVRDKLD